MYYANWDWKVDMIELWAACGASGALYTLVACVTGCACLYSCFYRAKMRQQFLLKDQPCCDCLVHCCCEPCALCQEYRELQNRGFDMVIGWHGNVEQRNRELAMTNATAPAMDTGMTRWLGRPFCGASMFMSCSYSYVCDKI